MTNTPDVHRCCYKVLPHLVAWKGVGKDTERCYSACLREITQNAARKKTHLSPIATEL
jgi:hypothetical protein